MGAPLMTTVTTEVPEARTHWERAARAVLAHHRDASAALEASLDADPELAAAHGLRGYGLLGLGRQALVPEAREALHRSQIAIDARGGTEAERALVDGLEAWCDGVPARCAAILGEALRRTPTDLLLAKLEHGCRFMIGDHQGMRASARRVLDASGPDAPGYGLGIAAFAEEETGELERAERLAREAVERSPDDAWGAHALSHVFEMRDQPGRGREWLEACRGAGTFAHCGSFAEHVAWHLALFCVQLGDTEEALAIHDDELLRGVAGDFRDVTNAASLLWRLEDAGVDVGARWRALIPRVLPYCGDHGYAFADAHYALALTRAGRREEARSLLGSLRRFALGQSTHAAKVQRALGRPLVEGIVALGAGEPERAYAALAVSRDGVPLLGGSHAQREVFRRLFIRAARATGRPEAVADAARAYLSSRPRSAWAASLMPAGERAVEHR